MGARDAPPFLYTLISNGIAAGVVPLRARHQDGGRRFLWFAITVMARCRTSVFAEYWRIARFVTQHCERHTATLPWKSMETVDPVV